MTEKLYDQDAGMLRFTAAVRACEPAGEGRWRVALDRTAFFPEGGGQPADQGTLGEARVLDAQLAGEEVLHLTDAPLPVGASLEGQVDAARRLDHSQQHSGEHIFSGIVHRLFGYDNVGFHLGADVVTMDFNGPMTEADARRVERLANEAVWADLPIETLTPTPEELARMTYRSKKALTGEVRVVVIPGVDACACCGTHVAHTGAIGQVRLVSVQKYKGGVRVTILCGGRALTWEVAHETALREAAVSLSCKPEDVPGAVQRLTAERDAARAQKSALAERLLLMEAEKHEEDILILVAEALETAQLGRAAARLSAGRQAALLLLPLEEGGWRFALTSELLDVRPAGRALLSAFGGRGGGPKDLVQGQLSGGTPEEIGAALEGAL